MEITEIRRAQLRKWFENRDIPPREKSYISQLMTGTASFGERAARRLERDYGMGAHFLDAKDGIDVVMRSDDGKTLTLIQAKTTQADNIDLMWVDSMDRRLLTLFHATDDEGRASILRTAEAMPRVLRPAVVDHKS